VKVIGILLYLWLVDGKPQVKLEQIPFRTVEECQVEGNKRIQKLLIEPSFVQGLHAECVGIPVTEAKK
jgi:hypothetical protein